MFQPKHRIAALRLTLGLLLALGAASQTLANTITDLYNTGVSAAAPASAATKVIPSGAALHTTTELHYTKVGAGGPIYVTGSPISLWISGPNSNWISEDGYTGATPNGGNYTRRYRTTFTLPASVDLSSVVIKGAFSVDNYLDYIVVNGHLISITTALAYAGFQQFALPSGPNNFFCAGQNTIDFIWRNVGGPGGLNVRWTQATYSVLSGTISDLFNTGVNNSMAKVIPGPAGTPELHYADITDGGSGLCRRNADPRLVRMEHSRSDAELQLDFAERQGRYVWFLRQEIPNDVPPPRDRSARYRPD